MAVYWLSENDFSNISDDCLAMLEKLILCTMAAITIIGFNSAYAPLPANPCATVANPFMIFIPLDPSSNATAPSSSPIPSPPGSFSAAPGLTSISLSWAKSEGTNYYNIQRWTYPTCTVENSINVSPPQTSHSDTGLVASTTYYYGIRAVNAAGISAQSMASATTLSPPPPPPQYPPNPPTGLQSVSTSSQINLSWLAAPSTTHYNIHSSTSNSGPFNFLASVTHPTTMYSHNDLEPSTTHHYRVYSYDTMTGQSTSYASTSATTLVEPLQPVVPSWIKELAGWWADGSVDDDSFINAIKWLIENNIIRIAATTTGSDVQSEIPSWVKNTANWWSEGMVSDNEFVNAIQYLIQVGVITISN